jgi:hypothetical protein
MKRIVALLVVAGLLAAMAATVYAETATVTINAGSLSVTPANVTLSAVTLDGTDKTSTSPYTSNAWTAEDARGTGAGWHLTIDATDFTDGGKTINISAADQEFKIQLLDTNIAVVSGNAKPTSSVTSLTAIPEAPAAALTFASAALNEGMGSYTLGPNFELEVPAETLAGNYSSTITVTAVTAP